MAKRITSERVKKWGIGIGATGIPLAVLLIWFMVSLGAIDITGYSGDIVCEGTELDPCYAYIDFTVNEDIFIYPSPNWSSTPFSTDIQPKSVQMYRSWGKGWREINLSKSCTGTWCGLSNSKDTRKFSFAFREGRDYRLRFKVLKNSPMDSIKWSYGPIDPTFFGWEDNTINYSNSNLTVEIKDALGKNIRTMTLSSHKSIDEVNHVWGGKNKVVMYYDSNSNSNETIVDGLGDVIITDMNTGKIVKKDYYFAERIVYEECYEEKNKTICIERERWDKLESKDIPARNITIGLITDVEVGDYYDAVWTIAGKKITKHALWDISGTTIDVSGEISVFRGLTTNGTFIWAGAVTGQQVFKYFPNGTYTQDNWDTSTESGAVFCLAVDSNYIYVGDASNNIDRYSHAGVYDSQISTLSGALKACTTNGTNIWYSDTDADKIFEMTGAGTAVREWVTTSQNVAPTGLYSNGTVSVFSADPVNLEVENWFMNGTFLKTQFSFAGGNGDANAGMTSNSEFVYIGDQVDNIIYLYEGWFIPPTLEGTPIITLEIPVNNTNFTSQSVDFTCNASDTEGMRNITLQIDEVNNITNSTPYYDFPSDDDFILINDDNSLDFGTGDFSMSIWINLKGYFNQGSAFNTIWMRDQLVNTNDTYYGLSISTDNKILFSLNDVSNVRANSDNALNDETWHHVVGRRENGVLTLWVDDIEQADTGDGFFDVDDASDMRFGRDTTGSRFMNGSLDEARLYNDALTDGEIASLYAAGRTEELGSVNLANLVSYWDFGQNNATDIKVINNGTNTNAIPAINLSVQVDGIIEGDHNWTCEAFDSSNFSITADIRVFNVDLGDPNITIDYPQNQTYNVNVSDLNYSIIEGNRDVCWFSKDGGITNSSTQVCETNFTDVISIEGSNNWTVFANDTFGNENQSIVFFFKDTIIPLIAFEPETQANATTLNQTFVYANVSITESNEVNITYELYWQNGTLTDSTFSTSKIREKNWTGLEYGIYLYNVTIFDVASNSNSTETRTIYLSDIFLFFEGNIGDLHIELNTSVNVTGNSSIDFGLICIDIDHPDYGINYTCSNQEITLNFSNNYFRTTTFWNGTKSFNFSGFTNNGTHILTNESINITSHQYDEVDDFRFNISSFDNLENLVFYRSNTSIIDRAYQGFLVAKNIYLNQSVDSAGTTFNNFENLTYNNKGNKTIYFYLDDNATIINITMNLTGKDYGFSYTDLFTNFSNIDESLTDAQLHYGPTGGFIQSPNSSLALKTFDDFNDNSIAEHWTVDGSTGTYGVRETGGYLEAWSDNTSISRAFNPKAISLWYYTSDYLSFDIDAFYDGNEGEVDTSKCNGVNSVKFGNQDVWISHMPGGSQTASGETSTSDVSFELTKINNTAWRINVSGTEVIEISGADDCVDTGNVDYVYDYTSGTLDTDWTRGACADTSEALSNSTIYTTDEAFVIVDYGISHTAANGCSNSNSYIRLDNLKNKLWNRTNGTIVSNSIFDSGSNIASTTFNISGFNGINYGNYSFFMWLSADNGIHWENAQNGVEHTFSFPGKNLKWKVDFNTTTPSYHNATAYIENVTVETTISAVSDVEFDFGNDGQWDYKLNGTFNETNESLVIAMPNADISSSFTSRRALYDHTYQIPLRIYSNSAGQLDIDIFNITYDPNPVIANFTAIQNFLDTYGSNSTNFSIYIGGQNGTVNVSAIQFDYAGGNDTIEITIRDILNTTRIIRTIYPYYSRWDYFFEPLNVDFLEFIPSTPTSLNVTPYGQTNSTPILNLTNYGYGDKNTNLSIYLNDTHSCVNLTMSTTWDKEAGFLINSTWRELNSGTLYLQPTDIYMWADYDCSWNNWSLFNPFIYFRQCADGVFCSQELD